MFLHLYVASQCVILVKFGGEIFQNLVAIMHVVNTGKYSPVKSAHFIYVCITRGKTFPRVIQIYPKFASFVGVYFPVFTAFPSQTFAVLLI